MRMHPLSRYTKPMKTHGAAVYLAALLCVAPSSRAAEPENSRNLAEGQLADSLSQARQALAAGARGLAAAATRPNLAAPAQPVNAAASDVSRLLKDHPECAAKNTAFDKLACLFDLGTLPQSAAVIGWRSGRLFNRKTPNAPEAQLLAGAMVPVLHGGGPLFGSTFKVASLYGRGDCGPDFYDALTPEDIEHTRASVERALRIYSAPVAGPQGLKLIGGDELRSLDGTLIIRFGASPEAPFGYSYYFRDVTPQEP